MNVPFYSRRTPGLVSRTSHASLATFLILTATDAFAQTVSPVQSKARPFNLEIVAPVMTAGSDEASARFQKASLPEITSYLQSTLQEFKGFDASAYALDPSKLLLRTESDVRVYFIGEGAGYQNTLGFNTGTYVSQESGDKASLTKNKVSESNNDDKEKEKEKEQEKQRQKEKEKKNNKDKSKETKKDTDKDSGKDIDKETDTNKDKDDDKSEDKEKDNSDGKQDGKEGNEGSDGDKSDSGSNVPYAVGKDGKLIFPDASSSVSSYDPSADASRSEAAPLLPGDFVDLGRFDAGTQLDFFLIANGAAGGTTTYSTQSSLNADGINHVVAFAYGLKDSPYIILGFEDLYGGGDKDFNDVLFAVDIGRVNLTALTATPEPATFLVLGCLLPFGYYLKRRRDQMAADTAALRAS